MSKLAVAYDGFNVVNAESYTFQKTVTDSGLVTKIEHETFLTDTFCAIDFSGHMEKILKSLSNISKQYGIPNLVLKPYNNNWFRRRGHHEKNLGRTTKDVYKTLLDRLSMEYSFGNHTDFMEIIKS